MELGKENRIPLPPPPPSTTTSLPTQCNTSQLNNQSVHERQVRGSYENEVIEACKRLFGERLSQFPHLVYCYNPISTVLQNGPTCGLVALQMAAQALALPVPAIEDLLQRGKAQNFTKQGEMFSADYLHRLAQALLGCQTQTLKDNWAAKDIIDHLVRGNPILMPYDADCNHEPCCKKGHKAHWATITGFVLNLANVPNDASDLHLSREPNWPNVSRAHSKSAMSGLDFDRITDIHLLGKQGKSKLLGLWSYDALVASNCNLLEMDPKKALDASNFVVPEGGIAGGLRGQILLLS